MTSFSDDGLVLNDVEVSTSFHSSMVSTGQTVSGDLRWHLFREARLRPSAAGVRVRFMRGLRSDSWRAQQQPGHPIAHITEARTELCRHPDAKQTTQEGSGRKGNQDSSSPC